MHGGRRRSSSRPPASRPPADNNISPADDADSEQADVGSVQMLLEQQADEPSCLTADEEDDDAECPVCLDNMSEAKTLDCQNGHTFCRACLRKVYAEAYPHILACPLCRCAISPSILKLRAFRPPKGGVLVTLRIGNTHSVRTTHVPHDAWHDAHKWECYVDVLDAASSRQGDVPAPATLVSGVQFDLHPTFDPRSVSVSASAASIPPEGNCRRFSVKRSGWGVFRVCVCEHENMTMSLSISFSLTKCYSYSRRRGPCLPYPRLS